MTEELVSREPYLLSLFVRIWIIKSSVTLGFCIYCQRGWKPLSDWVRIDQLGYKMTRFGVGSHVKDGSYLKLMDVGVEWG